MSSHTFQIYTPSHILLGSLFVACIITGYGGVFDTAYYHTEAQNFAKAKAITPHWHQIFIRGIGANWLVCLACFLAFSAREYFSKVVAIWWPTFAFTCLGFDHVVANMFFIPTGIFQHTPGLTVGYYIWKSMIPSLIGNIVGGGVFVGVVRTALHHNGSVGGLVVLTIAATRFTGIFTSLESLVLLSLMEITSAMRRNCLVWIRRRRGRGVMSSPCLLIGRTSRLTIWFREEVNVWWIMVGRRPEVPEAHKYNFIARAL